MKKASLYKNFIRVLWKEFRKLICHPMPWTVTVFFLLINLLLTYGSVGYAREYYPLMHDAILDYGISLKSPNLLTSQANFLSEEWIRYYGEYVASSSVLYDNLDMSAVLEEKLGSGERRPTEAYRNYLIRNYEKLQKRVEEIRKDGDDSYGFYPGVLYGFHGRLYYQLASRLLLETPILMMLCVLYLTDYERIHGTYDITTVTNPGKGILCRKILAGIGGGLACGGLLTAGSFGYFFYCVPFSGLWKVPVSTAILAEPRGGRLYPYITYWRLTFGGYFALTLVVFFLVLLTVGFLTAAIWLFLRNGFLAFLVQIVWYMGCYLLCCWNTLTLFDVFKNMNLSALWILCGGWFIENEKSLSFAGSEFACIGMSALYALALFLPGYIRYMRRDAD